MQPRELWWEIDGSLNGVSGLYILECTAEVRGTARARLRPGDPSYYQPSYKT